MDVVFSYLFEIWQVKVPRLWVMSGVPVLLFFNIAYVLDHENLGDVISIIEINWNSGE